MLVDPGVYEKNAVISNASKLSWNFNRNEKQNLGGQVRVIAEPRHHRVCAMTIRDRDGWLSPVQDGWHVDLWECGGLYFSEHQLTSAKNGYLEVSKNRGAPPKSSILIGLSIINLPFWGTPICWTHQFFSKSKSSGRFFWGQQFLSSLRIY